MKEFINAKCIQLTKRYSRQGLHTELERIIENNHELLTGNILFVGAGGNLEAYIRKNLKEGANITTIDIDPNRGPDKVVDISAEYCFEKLFDVVFCLEVLEHVSNAKDSIANIYSWLRDGGKVVASTPFLFPIHDAPYDYIRYTEHGLAKLFSNYREVNIVARSSYTEAIAILVLRLFFSESLSHKIMWLLMLPMVCMYLEFKSRMPYSARRHALGSNGYVIVGRKQI